jgi:hypothetical protein
MLMESVGNLYAHCWSNVLLAVLGSGYGGYDTPGSAFPAANINATGDIQIAIPFAQFRIRKIVCRNPLVAGVSGSVTGAAVGLYTAAAQGGTAIAAVGSNTLSNLSANLTFQELTLAAAAGNTIFTGPATYYFNVGTNVTNATIEVDIYGDIVFGKG